MLKGTLDDFTLPDILRFLASGRKTGCIEVSGSLGDGRVFLRDGEIYYGESSRTRGLDQEPSPDSIRTQIEDAVFDLLRWEMAEFDYSSGVEVEPGAAVDLNVESLIEETSRKLEELEVIATKIPNENAVMAMAPNPPAEAAEINITPAEWRILVMVSGTRSVADIADSVGQDSFSVMRTLYGLATTGLIELVEAPEPIAPPEPEAAAGDDELIAEIEPEPPDGIVPEAGTDSYIEALSAPLDGTELAEQMDAEFPPFDDSADTDDLEFDEGAAPPEADALPLAAADDTEAPGSEIADGDATSGAVDNETESESERVPALYSDTSWPDDRADGDDDVLETDPQGDSGQVADLEGAEAAAEPKDIPIEESNGAAVVDRLAAVKELADLFEKTDSDAAGPPYPAEMAAQRAAAGTNGDGRRRVEDDEEITRGLISRLIDGVKGL